MTVHPGKLGGRLVGDFLFFRTSDLSLPGRGGAIGVYFEGVEYVPISVAWKEEKGTVYANVLNGDAKRALWAALPCEQVWVLVGSSWRTLRAHTGEEVVRRTEADGRKALRFVSEDAQRHGVPAFARRPHAEGEHSTPYWLVARGALAQIG